MSKINLIAAALVTICLATQAQANSRPSGHTSYSSHSSHSTYTTRSYTTRSYASPVRSYSNYNSYRTSFAHGYYYRGRNSYNWSSQCYDARYGCTIYFDPYCSTWYYWCAPADCYYPVTYCPYGSYAP